MPTFAASPALSSATKLATRRCTASPIAITKLDKGERYVSLGSKGVPFSTLKGTVHRPATGLSTRWVRIRMTQNEASQ